MLRDRLRFLITCAALFAGACGGAPAAPNGQQNLEPNNLFPLLDGATWSYQVDSGDNAPPALAVTRVLQQSKGEATVITANTSTRYRTNAEGIWNINKEAWLLRSPIEQGKSWDSVIGRAKVLSTTRDFQGKFHQFKGCVAIEEVSTDRYRRVETTYCPGVGPVSISSSIKLDTSNKQPRVKATLLGYDLRPKR